MQPNFISFSLYLIFVLLTSFTAHAELQEENVPAQRSSRMVVLFLVDGLGSNILRAGIADGRLRNIPKFFLKGQTAFGQGQAAFPTLTYPNISAVLTTKPIGEQPVTANKMVVDGETINYESQLDRPALWRAVDPLTVFEKLRKRGLTSASFSYVLGLNATDHVSVTLREGLEYQNHEYSELDSRLLDKLEAYLSNRSLRDWPAFIYVHLVGVDGTAHEYGANSKQTKNYLNWLDKRLKATFKILAKAETNKRVTTILTADHGFVDTSKFVDVEKMIYEKDSSIIVTNENRFLGLYLPAGADRAQFERLLRRIRAVRGVELIVERKKSRLRFSSQAQTLNFGYGPAVCPMAKYSLALLPLPSEKLTAESFKCPEELNHMIQSYPFLVEGLSRYLNARNHPDAVVIAKPDTSFSKDYKGNHGGPTADETLVPVLLRNASWAGETIPHTSDLLKTLDSL